MTNRLPLVVYYIMGTRALLIVDAAISIFTSSTIYDLATASGNGNDYDNDNPATLKELWEADHCVEFTNATRDKGRGYEGQGTLDGSVLSAIHKQEVEVDPIKRSRHVHAREKSDMRSKGT